MGNAALYRPDDPSNGGADNSSGVVGATSWLRSPDTPGLLYDPKGVRSPALEGWHVAVKFACIPCGALYEGSVDRCSICFDNQVVAMPSNIRGREIGNPAPRRRAGIRRAGEIKPDESLAPYGGEFASWKVAARHVIEIHGPPGGGKSTAATQLAISASRQWPVLYIAVEEGHSVGLAKRLERCGLNELASRRLSISDAADWAEFIEDLDGSDARLVIIDSISELKPEMKTLLEVLGDRSAILISQVNARRGPVGGLRGAHLADLVAECVGGLLTVTKNRFAPPTTLRLFEPEVAS